MNEKGISLIEIVVCLSIMSIILAMVFRFVVIGVNTSTSATKDANVQKEAQTTVNQLKDWIMETNQEIVRYKEGVGYDQVIGIYQQEKDKDSGATQNFVQLVYYVQADRALYFDKKAISAEFDGGATNFAKEAETILDPQNKKNYVFANYVDAFEIDLTSQKDQKVRIKINYEDRGKKYEVDNVIKMRNVPKENPADVTK